MPTKEDLIAALVREREGYKLTGTPDQVKAVDAELKRLVAEDKPPAKRATTLKKKKPEKL